ncbi:hypothetical protein ACVIKO_000037 [Rhizobium ruizarguesonis]
MIAALTVLKTRSFCRRAEGLNIIYEVAERISASTALSESYAGIWVTRLIKRRSVASIR